MLLFDANFPDSEQFPRKMEIEVITNDDDSATTIVNGNQLGDPLWDNNYYDDGYRFHDIIHLVNVTLLGWSPVLRGLLKCRRKSNSHVYAFEDGPRARAVDEGIISFIFSYARGRNFFDITDKIDYNAILRIKEMTNDFEVSHCTSEEWECAILTGFKLWRQIREDGGGKFYADLDMRIIQSKMITKK